MSKSILVIDKVDRCCQCPFSGLYGDYCAIKDKLILKHIDKKLIGARFGLCQRRRKKIGIIMTMKKGA